MKKTVAVFFGGASPEHDISIITAIGSVIKPLELTKDYEVVPVYITKKGKWLSGANIKDIATYQNGSIDAIAAKAKPLAVSFDGGLTINKKRIDVAFPAMHGAYGEDGSLMGLLRLAGIPFVGADMDASVIAMDKVLAKQVVEANNILTPKFISFYRSEFNADSKAIMKRSESLHFPLFVKPSHLGSSIGITKVKNTEELFNAIEVACFYDEKIVVEEGVENLIEVTVPIMGNDEPVVALAERPLALEDGVFDFDTKYIRQGGSKGGKGKGGQGYSELPAKLPGKLYEQSIATALAVYKAIGITGLSRVDLLIDSKTKKVYFNEINPLPGDLYAHNWRAAGVSSVDLMRKLIAYAEEHFEQKKKLTTTFDSNFLQQF